MYGVVALKPFHYGSNLEYTRLEITRELHFDGLPEVERVISRLFYTSDSKHPSMIGSVVYWNRHSTYKRGKAFAKLPYMQHRAILEHGIPYDLPQDDIDKYSGVLCCVLTLCRPYWQKTLGVNDWRQLTPDVINAEWHKYFNPILGVISHG